MSARASVLILSGALAFSMACSQTETPPAPEEAQAAVDRCEGLNSLATAEAAEGWELLFDGKSMNDWHGYNGGDTGAWSIEDCALKCAGTEDDDDGDTRVDLASDGEYANFELTIEWKASPSGNSGLIYGVVEDAKYEAPWHTGPEYQLIDDEGQFDDEDGVPEELTEVQKAGANYAMHPANDQKELEPVGEWNTTRLVVAGNHVEHWLNGKKVLEFERWNDAWKRLRDSGKWKDYPDYGLARTGRIAIQDHGSVFWFRNIKIRNIEETGDDSNASMD